MFYSTPVAPTDDEVCVAGLTWVGFHPRNIPVTKVALVIHGTGTQVDLRPEDCCRPLDVRRGELEEDAHVSVLK